MKKRKRKVKQVDTPISSIGFDCSNRDKKKTDSTVMSLINEYSNLNPGISPKSLLRNFLLKSLPFEIKRLREEKVKLERAS